MRVAILITFLFCDIAISNPLPLPLDATDRIYMSSEHLTASISPDVAELRGTFTFQNRHDVPAPGQRCYVMLEIPIWFPETQPKDPSVAGFWKVFPKDKVTNVATSTRAAFEKAVGLRVSLGGESLPVDVFSTLTSTNSRQRWAPREWQQEAGLCCLVFRFSFIDDSDLAKKPLAISYRQPLLQANGVGHFFYLPEFQNLPKGTSTTNTNLYSITIVAQPGCSLVVTRGKQNSAVEAGHSLTLSPRHHQAIKATATAQPNTARGCVKTPRLGKTSLTFDI